MKTYYTIKEPLEGFYKEKGSKFYAHAFPVKDEQEIGESLEILRKKYHDARHHCYAWITGLDNQSHRANDDGEPSHSAGDPILGQLRSFELTNVLVVVVRYFGGTKLGVGGLIHAYKTAAADALEKAEKAELFEERTLTLSFPYSLLSAVERLVGAFDMKVINRDFMEDCKINARIKKDLIEKLFSKTTDLYNLTIVVEDDN